jgi:hypothetical protein
MRTPTTTFAAAVLALGLTACGHEVTPHDGGNGTDTGGTPMDSGGGNDGGGDNCAAATNCGDCTALGSCGWCTNTNTCHTGTNAAPDDMSCTTAQWAFLNYMCPGYDGGPGPDDVPVVPCSASTDCASCTAGSQCGWCANTNSCHDGSEMGPTDGTCTGTNWSWFPAMCPGGGG